MNLSTRLSLTMVALVVATAAAIWALAYQNMTSGVVSVALDRLLSRAGTLASVMGTQADAMMADIRALRHAPAIAAIAEKTRPDDEFRGLDRATWRGLLAGRFVTEMKSKQHYLQMRLIGLADGGREIIRVERTVSGAPLRVVADGELQQKGDRPYVTETMKLRDGLLYVSPIDFNREAGQSEKEAIPVLRIATPVYTKSGEPFGLIVINLDMNPVFKGLREQHSAESFLYLVNNDGDFLIHSDRRQEFKFEFGTPYRLVDEFPMLKPLFDTARPVAKLAELTGGMGGVAIWPISILGQHQNSLILIVPEDVLFAPIFAIRNSSLIAGGIAVICAILIAILLGRSMARPLNRITEAITGFRSGQSFALPIDAGGEIGALATAVYRLTEAERGSAAAIAFSDEPVIPVTLDGYITGFNAAAEELYDLKASAAIGRHLNIIVPPERRDEIPEILSKVAAGERIENLDTVRQTAGGKRISVTLTINPIRSSDGKVVGAQTIIRDFARKVRHEKRIRELQIESAHAERLNAAGEMVASLAHEINQPLTAVANYMSSVRRRIEKIDTPDAMVVRGYIDKAILQAQRAAKIISRVRGFVEKRQLRKSEADIAEVINEGLDLALTGLHAMVVHRHMAPDLPAVPMDKAQIQQVVVNLARNAAEAMDGRDAPELTVAVDLAGDDFARVRVSDNGPGLPQDRVDNLFQPFKSAKAKGMGIGLMICRSIIEAHNGKIWAENDPGGGVSFYFQLPLKSESEIDHAA